MSDIVFHIGLHKTATTTLQRQVFSKLRQDSHRSANRKITQFIRAATTCDPVFFDADHWRQLLAPDIPADTPFVISRESLSGAIYAGVGKRGLDHRSAILDNVIRTFPQARAILVIRRQDTLARSLYRQYLKVGGTESIDTFYGIGRSRSPIFPLDRFKLSPYVAHVNSLFSRGALLLVYEELADRPKEFLRKLGDFVGVDLSGTDIGRSNRTTLGATGMEVTRIVNKFCRSRLNPGGIVPLIPTYRGKRIRFVSLSSIIHDNWPGTGKIRSGTRIHRVSEGILERMREDNELLDHTLQLNLKSFGYY